MWGEYKNVLMQSFISQHGLIHQTTCPDTPQENGVAERKNKTLLDMTQAMMIESGVPSQFWPEAIATANYLSNRLPTKSVNYATSLDTLQTHTHVLSAHSLPPRVFGCVVYVHHLKRSRHKLEPRAMLSVFFWDTEFIKRGTDVFIQ